MTSPFEGCSWIGADKACESPILLRKFSVQQIKTASLYVTAFGYFEVTINDCEITQYRFLPVASDYEPRDFSQFLYPLQDKTTNRLYYYEFDVTKFLQEGNNVLSIQLANGWYRQRDRVAEGNVSYGDSLKTVYKLEITTDAEVVTICSDGTELWKESAIRHSNLFYGETVDSMSADRAIHPVRVLPAPETILSPAIGTPDKVIRSISPKLLGYCDGKAVYDAGENISGVVEVATSAVVGEKIVLQFAEQISEDLHLDFESAGGLIKGSNGQLQIQEDVFISDGTSRTYRPKFVWHGFQYFTVEGNHDKVTVKVIHSDTPITSTFESDSEGLNFLYDAFLRSQLSNMHGSFPSDCPHREKLGYTGDGQVCAPAAMLTLDCREFYEKWIQDILDCQDIQTGHIQHTAPFMGGGGGPGGWGCAVVMVPYAFYKQYGDTDMLQKCFEPMCRWIEYLASRTENGLITHEEAGGWCLGDWCTLESTVIPADYVNTCYFIKSLQIMEEIAELIGKPEQINYWRELRKNAENAVIKQYYAPEAECYANGVQGADAYAVWCGLADGTLVEKIAKKYDAVGHYDTGFLGTDILLEVLFTYGYGQTALRLLESRDMGSFLYMKQFGATTLCESWSGAGSWNHPMFGAAARHLFTGVLGIRQRPGTSGYRDVIIEPCLSENMSFASGSISTPNGDIVVSIQRTDEGIKTTVNASPNIIVELCS